MYGNLLHPSISTQSIPVNNGVETYFHLKPEEEDDPGFIPSPGMFLQDDLFEVVFPDGHKEVIPASKLY